MAIEHKHGYCALCISRCGCLGVVEDGRLVRVEADPAHPTGQALCLKAKAAPELVVASDRLTRPLRRTGPKGEDPGWVAITWEEALNEIAARLRQVIDEDGPRALALAVATPSGTAVADSFGWIHRLAHVLETPNLVFATENCNWHRDFAPFALWGNGSGTPDFDAARLIVLWGVNPAASWIAQAGAIQAARRRGARLLAIDPRPAGLAAGADLRLPVCPGQDGLLALGLARGLLAAGAVDDDFLRCWTDAPFLVDAEGCLLDAAHVLPPGPAGAPVVWDAAAGQAVPASLRPPDVAETTGGAAGNPPLRGGYRVPTIAGSVFARTVLQVVIETCEPWTPARTAEATEVPAADIEAAIALLAAHRPFACLTWTGTCQHDNATPTGRAIGLLMALTGSLDAPGGNVFFARPPVADIMAFDRVTPAVRAQTLGIGERPLGPPARGWITSRDLFRSIVHGEPYRTRALLAFGSNPAQSKPATRDADEAWRTLEFCVVADLFETPFARNADILLPVCSAWEREGLQAGFMIGAAADAHLQLRPPFVAPLGESRPDTWIVFELARRLGVGGDFFDGDPEAGLAFQLAPTGLTPQALRSQPQGVRLPLPVVYRKYQQAGFATPSGRLELHGQALRARGMPPWPVACPDKPAPPDERPGEPRGKSRRDAFPLILTTAKWPHFCHSQHRSLPSLIRRMPDPLVEVHPETAHARGLVEGDWAELSTRMACVRARVRYQPGLAPGVLCAQYGWWQWPDGAGDTNRLMDGESCDPVAGSNNLKAMPCELRRA